MLITPPELSAPEALDVMLQGAAKTAVTVLRIVHGPDTALVQAEVAGETTPGETVATTLHIGLVVIGLGLDYPPTGAVNPNPGLDWPHRLPPGVA